MRFISFAFSLSTMLAFNSFITLMLVAQYCEFCVLQLKLLNQINRMHFPNAVWARVTDELSEPVWTSIIFIQSLKLCFALSSACGKDYYVQFLKGEVFAIPCLIKKGKKIPGRLK